MRDCLFISHASPEDNQFVLWLSSRLQLMGYRVWCDLEQLKGGERDFWGRIEGYIRDESCKFLLVVSRNSMMSDGVLKEFHFAEQVAKEVGIQDFILPLWVEKVPYTIRIGISIYNKFNFENNWDEGLKLVVEKLEKDNVAKTDLPINQAFFDKIRYPIQYDIISGKKERYYTNWWTIETLPSSIYYFQYDNDVQSRAIFKEVRTYPVHRHGNVLVAFIDKLPSTISTTNPEWTIYNSLPGFESEILPRSRGEIKISKILSGEIEGEFPTLKDSENFLKRLLWKGFALLLNRRGIKAFGMSSKSLCFYYPNGLLFKNKTTVQYPKFERRKNLLGKQKDTTWHFGVSCKVQLHPFVSFNLKSHILFSDDGENIWQDSGKLHSARRKKGKTWFNEHWRDQLMAFLSGIKQNLDSEIKIELSDTFSVKMSALTQSYVASFGYREPKTNDRQNLINEFEEEEEEQSEIIDSPNGKE